MAEIEAAYLQPGGLQRGANDTTDLPSRPSQQDSTHLIIVTVRLPPSQPQNAPGHRPQFRRRSDPDRRHRGIAVCLSSLSPRIWLLVNHHMG